MDFPTLFHVVLTVAMLAPSDPAAVQQDTPSFPSMFTDSSHRPPQMRTAGELGRGQLLTMPAAMVQALTGPQTPGVGDRPARLLTYERGPWKIRHWRNSFVGSIRLAQAEASWLDRPLVNWNRAGADMPAPPAEEESIEALIKRCDLPRRATTAGEKALIGAGWIPFWILDQQLVRDDIEVIGGMRSADGMCRPANYNVFVFVAGKFAGVLSPTAMVSRSDSSVGVVRVAPPMLAAEFSRYQPSDPLCCPSSRQTVRYRIDRAAAGPLVVPVQVRTTRQ